MATITKAVLENQINNMGQTVFDGGRMITSESEMDDTLELASISGFADSRFNDAGIKVETV